MSDKNAMPATDSARELKPLVHDDVTADFESDPKFVNSNATESASSENLVMRDTDDEEESDDEIEDEDDDDLEDDEDEDDDEDDLEDAEGDDELEDDEDDDLEDDEDDDEDEDLEDDEDEVGASSLVLKRAA